VFHDLERMAAPADDPTHRLTRWAERLGPVGLHGSQIGEDRRIDDDLVLGPPERRSLEAACWNPFTPDRYP